MENSIFDWEDSCEGDTIYDIGEKATGVYFRLKGSVAICIPS